MNSLTSYLTATDPLMVIKHSRINIYSSLYVLRERDKSVFSHKQLYLINPKLEIDSKMLENQEENKC